MTGTAKGVFISAVVPCTQGDASIHVYIVCVYSVPYGMS